MYMYYPNTSRPNLILQALLEAQEQFKTKVSTAESDLAQLAALDKKIKSFNINSNPYTLHTVSYSLQSQEYSNIYQPKLCASYSTV